MEQGLQRPLRLLGLVLMARSDSLVASPQKHNGAIKALQFNPKHSNLLATGGMKGEVCLSPSVTAWLKHVSYCIGSYSSRT